MLTIDLPKDMEQSLNNEARREGRSLPEVVKDALRFYLEDREDYEQGIKTLEQIRSGKEKTISLDALRHELGN